jgi:hypothetical protein
MKLLQKEVLLGAFIAVSGAIWFSLSTSSSAVVTEPILRNLLEFFAMIFGAAYLVSIRH